MMQPAKHRRECVCTKQAEIVSQMLRSHFGQEKTQAQHCKAELSTRVRLDISTTVVCVIRYTYCLK